MGPIKQKDKNRKKEQWAVNFATVANHNPVKCQLSCGADYEEDEPWAMRDAETTSETTQVLHLLVKGKRKKREGKKKRKEKAGENGKESLRKESERYVGGTWSLETGRSGNTPLPQEWQHPEMTHQPH